MKIYHKVLIVNSLSKHQEIHHGVAVDATLKLSYEQKKKMCGIWTNRYDIRDKSSPFEFNFQISKDAHEEF